MKKVLIILLIYAQRNKIILNSRTFNCLFVCRCYKYLESNHFPLKIIYANKFNRFWHFCHFIFSRPSLARCHNSIGLWSIIIIILLLKNSKIKQRYTHTTLNATGILPNIQIDPKI